MDFKDQIKLLGDRVTKLKHQIATEEATKNAFIMPFLQILGYDVFGSTLKLVEYMFYSNVKYKWITIQKGVLGWKSGFYEIDLSGGQTCPA